MKNLFNFIFKHIHWLLFFLLTTVSLYLLVKNSEYQRSKYLTVFQEVAGRVYSVSSNVQSYLNLKKDNADLMLRVSALEEERQVYKNLLDNLNDKIKFDSVKVEINQKTYQYTHARVSRNKVSGIDNFIFLNKGSNQGITEDMAIVSINNGIVGVVMTVSPNYSRVISALNSRFRVSGMIKNTRFSGTLFWDGKDSRYISLSELPSHASYAIGDTIITSGYSAFFPEGILVGVIEGAFKQKNEESNSLKIRLFTDFSTLSEVFIIRNPFREELLKIEKGVGE